MFRNIKTVKHIEAQSFLVDGFYGYSKYPNHSPFIYKPIKEIHDMQVPKYDFDKYLLKIQTNFFYSFLDWL